MRADFDARWRATIAGWWWRASRRASSRPVDPTEFAITLSALLDGFAVQIALEDAVVSPETAFACAMTFAADKSGLRLGRAEGAGGTAPVQARARARQGQRQEGGARR